MVTPCAVEFSTLVDLVEERLSEEVGRSIEDHLLQGCPDCHDRIEWIRNMITNMRTDRWIDPPFHVMERAVALFASHPHHIDAGEVRRMVARLIFDSRTQPALSRARGGPFSPRQLLYSAGPVEIDLQIEPSEKSGRKTVVGQVLLMEPSSESLSQAQITLSAQDGSMQFEIANHLGEFVFRDVMEGRYSLGIHIPGAEITVEEADI